VDPKAPEIGLYIRLIFNYLPKSALPTTLFLKASLVEWLNG
jgi:hypothetical protein